MDKMPVSQWADCEASLQVPILRAQGEGQALEYMKEFPANTRELAKEVAAFATSNAGTILIGVDNSGDCIGLSNVENAAERDSLFRRVEGICHGTVKPSITPTARFAQEVGKTVLVLTVPKGGQPVYYANGIPYIRHITSSRPAEPHEVIELILNANRLAPRATSTIQEEPDERVQFLADLMRPLVRVKVLGEEIDERMINPWLDIWRAQFADAASELRQAAVKPVATVEKLETALLDTAEALNAVAKMRLHLGAGSELSKSADEALNKNESLLARVSSEVIAHVDRKQLLDQLDALERESKLLAVEAAAARTAGGIEGLQARAAELGARILFTSQYGVNRLVPDLRSALTDCGRRLHLAETRRVYLDGGVSVNRIIDEVLHAVADFSAVVKSIPRV
jgi:ATP-dependent DNA helicase RecG